MIPEILEQIKEYEKRILALPGNYHDIYKAIEHARVMIREKEEEAMSSDLRDHEHDMKTLHWFADVIVRGLVEEVFKNTIEDLESHYEKTTKHYTDGVE